MQQLEAAGIADKTCIVLTNDHYPYGLTEEEYNELAGQTLDTKFEKYRNSFICYVPGLSENIVVDEYCSTADILPTLLNLFGVEYDSRLLAGTDVLLSLIHISIVSCTCKHHFIVMPNYLQETLFLPCIDFQVAPCYLIDTERKQPTRPNSKSLSNPRKRG